MKFALLGVDADVLALAQGVVASQEHVLTSVCEVEGAEEQLRAIAPRLKFVEFWESLLASDMADAVIVGRGPNADLRAEQLRKLVQAGVPLILTHPVDDSMLICYELDMIRRETGCIMLPYIPYRWHEGLKRLARMVADSAESPIGATEQIILERSLTDRDRPQVVRQFARDVELLRALAGELTSVSALAPGGKEEAVYANLGVQLTGPRGMLARWSVSPADHGPGATILVRGSRGKATLNLPPAGGATTLEIVAAGQTTNEAFPAWDPATAALAAFQDAMAGRPASPTWSDACRDVELSEAIARSLAKGRTIELHDEEHSEHGTFKGTMTSVGCGLLLASLVLLLVAAALASMTGLPFFGYAPYLILGVLGIFLLLQSLKLVFSADE
jgi:predicted dehydrogenase